ncbi:MAG: hypothetical protein GXO78_12150 [Calditrichaeota bacterium]|nr:hypothetical protein [Calditrichota bacterium]
MKGIPNRQKKFVQPREFKFIQRIRPGILRKSRTVKKLDGVMKKSS